MADFGLIKSFDIDCGQLDGFSPQQCFVLGYELALIDDLAKGTAPFNRPVHSANRERIEKSLNDAGRAYKLTWCEGDSSEEWMLLDVRSGSDS